MISPFTIEAGAPYPLGASFNGEGVNFALFSAHAERVELCFLCEGKEHSISLSPPTHQVWHVYVRGLMPQTKYAYRVYGPSSLPHRFNPHCLLLDPYARAVEKDASGEYWGAVVHEDFDWQGDSPPHHALQDSVLLELHVKGATRLHTALPEALRGSYRGLASPPMIQHFKALGVTALNLLPIHYFIDEPRLLAEGRVNYWGYNTLSFFAPATRYASHVDGQSVITEFKTMVRTLHAEGIEVILDVVFNHTAESDEFGPTLSFRGIDNVSYYRIPENAPESYENFSGCGNTLNLKHPRVLQLVMDSLRYWVTEMHVDGFRFDLAVTLTRESAFLHALLQDPVLSSVKLIAEPWDLGPEGYRLGQFAAGWSEWNDRFRDDVRAFWLSRECGVGAMAQRIAGSSEIFNHGGRTPLAGINFITAHDGFTLQDLVSYNHKHNAPNGEENRDGHSHNLSWNCGEEGETSHPDVLKTRRDLKRALLATLFLAQGVPMLQAGDELGRTQKGNNNAYCQDNLTTWIDWAAAEADLIAFTGSLIAIRRRFPQLRQGRWLSGKPNAGGQRDIVWWHASGREMEGADWESVACFGFILAPITVEGQPLFVFMNPCPEVQHFALPMGDWRLITHTSSEALSSQITYAPPRSILIFSQETPLHL